MRRRTLRLLVIFVSLMLLGLLWLSAKRTAVFEGKSLQPLWPYFALLAKKPDDYWNTLATSPIDFEAPNAVHSLTLKHRYIGQYVLKVATEKPIPAPVETHNWGSILSVACEQDSAQLLSVLVGENPSPAWSEGGDAFTLLRYRVPEDLPQGVSIDCKVTVVEPSIHFKMLYGTAILSVDKISDS